MDNRRLLGVLLVIIAVAIAVFYGLQYVGVTGTTKTEGYQAVFLTNGQVYFGKVTAMTPSDYTLEDIYYLQVQQQNIQPEQQGQQPKLSLVKLGNELHGPRDKMVINRDQILFWENLKDDGRVVTAINDHKAGRTTPATTTPANP